MKFKYENEQGEIAIFELIEGSDEAIRTAYKEDIDKLRKHPSGIAQKLIDSKMRTLAKGYIPAPNGFNPSLEVWGIVKDKQVLIEGNYPNKNKSPEQELGLVFRMERT
jgi:hypothetical protein